MIFALADLAQYILKVGRYSARSLEAHGLVRATPESLKDFDKNGLQPGSLLFYHNAHSLASWAIMYYSNGPLSHTALLYDDGQVFDATTSGVIIHPIKDYFDGRGYVTLVKTPWVLGDDARAFIRDAVGRGFAWGDVFRLWLWYVCGADVSYRPRFTIDFLILFAGLIVTFWRIPILAYEVAGIAVVYLSVLFINIAHGRHRTHTIRKQVNWPEVINAFEYGEALTPPPGVKRFQIGLLVKTNDWESFAAEFRKLAALPDQLGIQLPAAILGGYRLWGAMRDGELLAVLGAHDTWSITWGDHVLIQDLVATDSDLGGAAAKELVAYAVRDSANRGRRCIYLQPFRLKKSVQDSGEANTDAGEHHSQSIPPT